MKFSRWVFRLAGAWGLLVLLPQYFLEQKYGEDYPPAISHPEFYYGFLGVTVAWQLVYLTISYDPLRYRPIMLLGVLAKSSFTVAAVVLFIQERLAAMLLTAALIDLFWAVLFLAAWYALAAKRADLPAQGSV